MGKPVRLTEVFLAVFPCKRRGVVPRRSVKMEVSNRMEALFQSLTEGAVIVQIGDAVLREQKISYVHFAASFLRAGARPYSAFPAF